MHAFVDQTLLVFDAFGLTRITTDGKAKLNKKVVGEFLVANGSLLIGHSEVSRNRFAMTVPDLKVVPIDDKWNYNLKCGTAVGVTPDGLPYDAEGATLNIYKLDGGAPKPKQKVAGTAKPAGPARNPKLDNGRICFLLFVVGLIGPMDLTVLVRLRYLI